VKWNSNTIIETIEEQNEKQFGKIHRMNNLTTQNPLNNIQNQNLNSISILNNKSIITGALIGAVGLTLVPLLPVVLAFLIGHWLATNNKK